MSVEREMSLAEWCAKLPSLHLVNQELSTLNTQLAALAEQNEKLRSAVRWIQDRCAGDAMPRWEPGMRTTHSRGLILDRTNYVLDLPDLASPVLNRIRAEGMRISTEIHECEDVLAPVGNSVWGEAYQQGWIDGTAKYRDVIHARAAELEKSNG